MSNQTNPATTNLHYRDRTVRS